MNSDRPRILLRALVATLFAVVIAALSHGAGGATPASLAAVVLATILALPVVLLLQRLRAPLARQVLIIGLSQLAFHTLFWLSPAQGIVASSSQSHHLTNLILVLPTSSVTGVGSGTGNMDMGMSGTMTVAHVLAGILTLAMWRYGDALSRAVADTIVFTRQRLAGLADIFVPVVLRFEDLRLGPWNEIVASLRHRLLNVGLRHRGPPALVF